MSVKFYSGWKIYNSRKCIKMSSVKCWLYSSGLNVLNYHFEVSEMNSQLLSSMALPIISNSLWPSGAIWCHRTWSNLAQVMACCLTAPSHYLNQCWLIMSELLGAFTWGQFHRKCSRYLSLIWVLNTLIQGYSCIYQRPMGWCSLINRLTCSHFYC